MTPSPQEFSMDFFFISTLTFDGILKTYRKNRGSVVITDLTKITLPAKVKCFPLYLFSFFLIF